MKVVDILYESSWLNRNISVFLQNFAKQFLYEKNKETLQVFVECFYSLHTLCKPSVQNTVYGKRSFLSKESDTSISYRVYISPTM